MRFWFLVTLLVTCSLHAASSSALSQPRVFCQKTWKGMEWEGMKIRLYRLRAEAFPSGETFKLRIRNSDGSTSDMFTYIANAKGHLILSLEENLKKAAPYIVTPMRRGEKVTYGMLSEDGLKEYMTDLIPFPIESTKHDVSVSLEIIDMTGESFLCRGKGFLSQETLQVICEREEDQAEYVIVTSAEGAFELPLNLAIAGQESGNAALIVKRKKEEFALPFVWGKQANTYVGACCLEVK